jgi:hypothetical protein
MAKCTITFEDGDEWEGQVDVTVEFDPEITEESCSPAQSGALECLQWIQDRSC